MTSFRYRAVEGNGASVGGVIEAEDRKAALRVLGDRGLFPSSLEPAPTASRRAGAEVGPATGSVAARTEPGAFGSRVRRKEVTAFTREMSALLGAAIPIPQALDGLAEEENPALREIIGKISESVRKGTSFSAALQEHRRCSRIFT